MTGLLVLAAQMVLGVAQKPPLIIKGDKTLTNFEYEGEIWLGEGDFVLRDVSCRGIRLSRVTSAELTRVKTDGAEFGLWIIGGKDITVRDSVFRNHKIGIEGGPGHPWTFPDEAKRRNLPLGKGGEWVLGMNLGGMLETRGQGVSFMGNGLNRVAISLGKNEQIPYKLDTLPLSGNHWDVTGKSSPRVVAESSKSFVLEAEGIFEKGKRYWAHTYNQSYEIKNVEIYDSRFEKCRIAGVSLYFSDGARIERNYCPDITEDYQYGLEHARNAVVADNRTSTAQDSRIRIGMIGRMENITLRGNGLPYALMHRHQPELGIKADKPINYVDGRSPWVGFR